MFGFPVISYYFRSKVHGLLYFNVMSVSENKDVLEVFKTLTDTNKFPKYNVLLSLKFF